MYALAKSCVISNNDKSECFPINRGVRQGENLSPILFALYLNDLKDYMEQEMNGLSTIGREAENVGLDVDNCNKLLKLFILLYADDTIILSESEADLQRGLNSVEAYCKLWDLKLNASKCKIVIFSRGKVRKYPNFKLGSQNLEVVSNFLYLGLKLNFNNKMNIAQKDLNDRASRAMFALLKKCNSLSLPPDIMVDLFDKMLLPIITYGSDIWGFEIKEFIHRFQTKYYKRVFNLNKSTPTFLILGELGKFPVDISIKSRMMSFWLKLVSPHNENKLSSIVYKLLHKLYLKAEHRSSYISCIQHILTDIGMPSLWETHYVDNLNPAWFKEKVSRSLKDLFLQRWYSHISSDSIYTNYRMFKPIFQAEPYLRILPTDCVKALLKFRVLNNKLPVNRLRFEDIPRNERICKNCNINEVGDEFHYLFSCPFFNSIRNQYITKYYIYKPSSEKFTKLLNSINKKLLFNLKRFITIIQQNII